MKFAFFCFSIFTVLSFSAQAIQLKLLNEVDFPYRFDFKNTLLGGLSGLSYDSKSGDLYAISDDRSENNPARFYSFQLTPRSKGFSIEPKSVTVMHRADGQEFPKLGIDAEGIALSPWGTLFISSEGDMGQSPRINPSVFESTRDGKWIRDLEIPMEFLPNSEAIQTRGVANNLAFESLSISPSGKSLFVGAESALVQDGPLASFDHGATVRFFRYPLSQKEMKPLAAYAYPLDAVPAASLSGEGTLSIAMNGVSDFLALDEDRLLVMERGCVVKGISVFVSIRLYEVNLSKASDVLGVSALKDQKIRLAEKKLVLSVGKVVPSVDNLEGMSFGPILPNGKQSLVLVSDSNFKVVQKTQFLVYEVNP